MNDHSKFTTRLRTFADFLETHPELPLPYVTHFKTHTDVHWYLHINGLDLDKQKTTAAQLVSTIGGKWDKRENNERLDFLQEGELLTYEVSVARDAVCERVVTGSHEVTTPARPASPAVPERTETVEIVEWVCGSLLGGDES